MTEADELLRAICLDPEDMTARLAYADWCEKQGNPRGEFIRCQLAGADGTTRTADFIEGGVMSEQELQAIRERCEAADKAPWVILSRSCGHDNNQHYCGNNYPAAYCYGDNAPANITFVAHTRTDVPALLAEVERLRALLAEFVDVEPCRYDHHGYCQTHNLGEKPCCYERAREMLK